MICVHCREPMTYEPGAARRACSGTVTVVCTAVSPDAGPAPTREDAIRAAEHEVVVALREQTRIGGQRTGDVDPYLEATAKLNATMEALDALLSPLPSRAELESVHEVLPEMSPGRAMEGAGAYWLRWVSIHDPGKFIPADAIAKLRAFADELDARK